MEGNIRSRADGKMIPRPAKLSAAESADKVSLHYPKEKNVGAWIISKLFAVVWNGGTNGVFFDSRRIKTWADRGPYA